MTNWLDEALDCHRPLAPPLGFSNRVISLLNNPKSLLMRGGTLSLAASFLVVFFAFWSFSDKRASFKAYEVSAVSEIDAICLSHEFLMKVGDPLIIDALVWGAPEEVLELLASAEN